MLFRSLCFGLCSYSIYCCVLVCAVTIFIVVFWFVQLQYLLLCLVCAVTVFIVVFWFVQLQYLLCFISIWCYVFVVAYSCPYRSVSNMHCSSYCALDKGRHAVGVSVLFFFWHNTARRRHVISEDVAPFLCLLYDAVRPLGYTASAVG